MIDILNGIDADLLIFLNSFHCPYFDRFMMMATGRWTWIPFYAALFVLLIHRHGWRRSLVWLAAISLAVVLADQLCASVIRPCIGRMRPANDLNPLSALVHIVEGYRGGPFGFPSCHGSNSFALAIMTSLIARRAHITLLMLAWAVLHVYSRIYLGVHYPGDILAGAIIGGICAALAYVAGRFALRRLNFKPHIYRPHYLLVPSGISRSGAVEMIRLRITCEAAPVAAYFATLTFIILAAI